MNSEVIEFINRRFPETKDLNNRWLTGNCYYFSLILANRFSGVTFYDVINGHFVTLIERTFYDASGVIYELSDDDYNKLIENDIFNGIKLKEDFIVVCWKSFYKYDCLQKERIIRDCIS